MEHPTTQIPKLFVTLTKHGLADAIGVPFELVERRAFTKHQSLLYSRHEMKKRDGSVRVIHTPHWPLMNIQKKIAKLLDEIYAPSNRASGYVVGRGIKYNASLHLGKRLILNIDLKDFFPSIHFGRIRGRLMSRPYDLPSSVATTIARLCTLDGKLPIGSPSSPVLSNMIASHLDGLLTKLARENGCFYSRYADDITFSTNRRRFPPSMVRFDESQGEYVAGNELAEAVKLGGFLINERKTRVLDKNSRQEVTGVVLNEFTNVRRNFMRDIRGALNAWEKHGLKNSEKIFHEKYNWRGSLSFETHLRGRIQHLIHIRGDDDLTVWKLVQRFNSLEDREQSAIRYHEPQDERARLSQVVCRVETAHEDKMEWRQGSGIKLPNGTVLTNYHNIEIDGEIAPKIEVFLREDSQFSVPMKVTRFDKAKDAAILEAEDSTWSAAIAVGSAEVSFSDTSVGHAIKVGGYPSYVDGDSCQIASGEVRSFSKLEGIEYFRVSVPIVKGNSGGPVFNEKGQVIGMASRGIDTHEIANAAFNGCLHVSKVERLIRDS